MAQQKPVAPKERVNIVHKTTVGGAQEEVELPLRIVVTGDFTQREDSRAVEDRAPIRVDKDGFGAVLSSQDLSLTLVVTDRLSGESGATRDLALRFGSLEDFTPEGVAAQVPEFRSLLELREALVALRGPLANQRAFRQKVEALITDRARRERLLRELGLASEAVAGEVAS
jgi:type VI secretion system protein ImpB